MPFTLMRRQFPIRVCYAMTINKSQGQSIQRLGIYLPDDAFTHGQLYVALSRSKQRDCMKVVSGRGPGIVRNIVYRDVFCELHGMKYKKIDS
jgi:hypothetical protein